jgi:hypothetical protein
MRLPRSLTAPLRVGALLALGACFPQFGEYGGEGGRAVEVAGAPPGGSGGAPLPESCGADRFCVDIPTGWQGPVALSDPNGACGGAYATEVAAGETHLSGAPVSCGCECGAAAGSICPSATVTRSFTNGCANTLDTISVPSAGCTNIALQNAGSWSALAVAVNGACPPDDRQETPKISFDERVLCSAEAAPTCDDGALCSPHPGAGFEPRLCIAEDGDVECPSASFAVKTLLFTGGHQDTRACDVACTCEPPSAVCAGVVSAHQGPGCGAVQDGVLADGTCDDEYVSSNAGLSYFPMLVSQGSCDPLPRAPLGEVSGLAPITVCCSGVL